MTSGYISIITHLEGRFYECICNIRNNQIRSKFQLHIAVTHAYSIWRDLATFQQYNDKNIQFCKLCATITRAPPY